MKSIIIFLVVFGLIWEIIDRIKKQPKPQERPKREEVNYSIEYFRNAKRIFETDSIELEISLEFYRNLEHKKDYIQSFVEYNGRRVYIRFYDWTYNPLRSLADCCYNLGI